MQYFSLLASSWISTWRRTAFFTSWVPMDWSHFRITFSCSRCYQV